MVHLRRLLVDAEPSMPPASVNILPKHYINETKFDTNMVIILAVLLCALLCALGLNSIVRCLLRCTHRFGTAETQQQAATRLATTGVKKHSLRKIPIAIYGSEIKFSTSECPICLAEFVEGEKVRVLPKCSHGFHVKCIDTWLESHSSCPNCRRSLLERSTSRVADESCVTEQLESNSSRQQQASTINVVVAQV